MFSGQPPNEVLNQILDDVILTPKCPFRVAEKVLDYLKDIFIFYDLTAKNFLKSYHYCLLDQYSRGNAYSVCATTLKQAKKNIKHLKHDDFETIRRLPSFRPYVEAMKDRKEYQHIIDIFENDEFLRKCLMQLVPNIYTFYSKFYGYLRFFWILVKDLPKTPFGKQLSDIYMYCHMPKKSVITTDEFEKSWQLLGLMSKDEFAALLEKCYQSFEPYEENYLNEEDTTIDDDVRENTQNAFDETSKKLRELIDELKQDRPSVEQNQPTAAISSQMYNSRTEFYKTMKQQQSQAKSDANNAIRKVLDFLRIEVVEKYFPPRHQAPPLLELFVYTDYERVRSNLRGTSRSAIHKALTDPHSYLQVI